MSGPLAGIDTRGLPDFDDRARWPELRERLTRIFAQRSRGEWCALLEGGDGCFAPVLTMREAPAPRFSRTPAALPVPPTEPGDARGWARLWGVALPNEE